MSTITTYIDEKKKEFEEKYTRNRYVMDVASEEHYNAWLEYMESSLLGLIEIIREEVGEDENLGDITINSIPSDDFSKITMIGKLEGRNQIRSRIREFLTIK